MDEDLETEDMNPEGAAALGGLDPQAQLAALFARYPAIEQKRQAERERIKAAKAARFEAARADIEQRRFGAPTTRDKLFALSEALASPRYYGGIAGTMSRVAPVLGEMSKLQSSADAQRADAMRQLREQYAIDAEDDVIKALEAESAAVREQMKILAPLAKPRTPSTTSPVIIGPDAVVRSRTTGSTITEPPQGAIYTLQAYLGDPSNTPQNKIIARRSFDEKFGYGASNIYGGQQ